MSVGREWDENKDKVLLGGGSLRPQQVDQLVEVMWRTPMGSPDRRQGILDWVIARHASFSPRRDAGDRNEITKFITAALVDDEGFDYLLEAIQVYTAPDDPALAPS